MKIVEVTLVVSPHKGIYYRLDPQEWGGPEGWELAGTEWDDLQKNMRKE